MMKNLNFIENDITVIVNQKLLELFKRSCVFFKFIPKDLFKQSFSYDYYILSASLGAITRKSINSFENQEKNYLKSNKNLTEKIISKIKKDNNYICGISWKSKNEDSGADKSISLQSLLPILKLPNITFVNLQYGDIKSEIEMLYKNYNIDIKIIEEIDNFNDIDGLASLIDACDFVITTSNVTVHLAGGLGKETYLLVPFAKGRIWYWHDNDTESIWYPSVKIFRQPSINLWSKPIDEIAQIIKVKNNERSN